MQLGPSLTWGRTPADRGVSSRSDRTPFTHRGRSTANRRGHCLEDDLLDLAVEFIRSGRPVLAWGPRSGWIARHFRRTAHSGLGGDLARLVSRAASCKVFGMLLVSCLGRALSRDRQ